MMRLRKRQVPILDICEQLKAAGVPQRKTYWVWQKSPFGGWILTQNKLLQQGLTGETKDIKYSKFLVDAPTVAELGEMLPDGTISARYPSGWHCKISSWQKVFASTEVDARAMMLIYLLGKGLVTP